MVVGLPVLAGTQLDDRARWGCRRFPSGDGPGACACLRVVSNPRKPPPQLNGGRELAFLIEDIADRCGIGFGDYEHRKGMAMRATTGNLYVQAAPPSLLPLRGNHICDAYATDEVGRTSL